MRENEPALGSKTGPGKRRKSSLTLSRRVLNFNRANLMACISTRRAKGHTNSDFCQVCYHHIQVNENWLSCGARHTVRMTPSLCILVDFLYYVNLIYKGTLSGAQQNECRFGPSVQCEKVLSVKIVYQNDFWSNSF